ncbi:uncharacterized protein I206_106716 [Kwoniella pini CBS 10737]|uniref:DUF4604 domain-containing protein n=1 Tax=Kwoniella pini CBS 10737 TaxID=1296096 RepID=A0A1B9HTE3_9TREE|nr:uncharacterized protein I206_07395 [Kwoniella pini CBS 10737]OCF46542.1 hypothetical protein I206_07395 [Kwoniella pini CBS 10737]
MSRKGMTKQQYSTGLTYISNKPKFLQNFGLEQSSTTFNSEIEKEEINERQNNIPSRPKEGKWSNGSDDEKEKQQLSEEDEWEENFGGGGGGGNLNEDGPQIVVLKKGKHLNEDEFKKLRKKIKGESSLSPPPISNSINLKENKNQSNSNLIKSNKGKIINNSKSNLNKRKLVGVGNEDLIENIEKDDNKEKEKKNKNKKPKKGMLSFNEAEGEE